MCPKDDNPKPPDTDDSNIQPDPELQVLLTKGDKPAADASLEVTLKEAVDSSDNENATLIEKGD